MKVFEKKALLDHLVDHFSELADKTFSEENSMNPEGWSLLSFSIDNQQLSVVIENTIRLYWK